MACVRAWEVQACEVGRHAENSARKLEEARPCQASARENQPGKDRFELFTS